MLQKKWGLFLRDLGQRLSHAENRMPLEAWQNILRPHIKCYAPVGAAKKYSTIILVHGCGGDFLHLETWARFLAEKNYLVYTIDSLTPRHISIPAARCFVCTGFRLQGPERSRDLGAALPIILADPRVDATNLHLLGWSHGAWTIMEWLLGDAALALLPKSLSFIYPYCGLASVIHQKSWPYKIPTLVVTAEKDMVVPNQKTRAFIEQLGDRKVPLSHESIAGAPHGFDLYGTPAFDAAKTGKLQQIVTGFLRR